MFRGKRVPEENGWDVNAADGDSGFAGGRVGGVVYFLLEHPNDVGVSDLPQSVVCALGENT